MRKLLNEVWPITRLLYLLYRAHNNVIADSLDVDLVASFRRR